MKISKNKSKSSKIKRLMIQIRTKILLVIKRRKILKSKRTNSFSVKMIIRKISKDNSRTIRMW